MATKVYLFSGIGEWVKCKKPDEKFDNYQVPLYLDEKSWKIFNESGCQLKVKDGSLGKYVVFKRRHVEFNYARKEQQVNGPPKVKIRAQDGSLSDFDGLIGNGSRLTVQVDVYDTRNGKGHRLIGIVIDELVEYNPDGNLDAGVFDDTSSSTDASVETKLMPF